ncbi:MAG: hypothetical protein AAGJ10_04290 [Bacteroidota bacterium]
MRYSLLLCVFALLFTTGCTDAFLTAALQGDQHSPPVTQAIEAAVDGEALTVQEIELFLSQQPNTYYQRVNDTFQALTDPGEKFIWQARLDDAGAFLEMYIEGLIPQVGRYVHGSRANAAFGTVFRLDYTPNPCGIWTYSSVHPLTVRTDESALDVEVSDAQRITGTFSATLERRQISFFIPGDACPNGVDATPPSEEFVTVTGRFDIERPNELPIIRKAEDGQGIIETWRAP